MATSESEENVTLKLILIKEGTKVLFAEAKKDFLDVLISFLTLPLGTIARLFRQESNMPIKDASLSSLYQSVEDLDNVYLCEDTCKEMLLLPKNSMELYCKNVKLNIDDTEPTKYFVCDNVKLCRFKNVVLVSTANSSNKCRCGHELAHPINHLSSDDDDGFVKSTVSFLIMDDLTVVPNTLDTVFSLMKNSGIKDMSSVNEVTVTITKNKVLHLLKNCLYSKTPLTNFFLKNRFFKSSFRIKFPPHDYSANESGIINIKVMRRKSTGKILFAQGKEDFANLLFTLLTFSLGEVVQVMEGCSSDWSIDRFYNSVISLEADFWTSKDLKNKFVNPIDVDIPNFFVAADYELSSSLPSWYLTSTKRHESIVYKDVEFVDSVPNVVGYVNRPSMFMATDDLVVTPMSSICVMSLLNRLKIPFSDLEEKEVCIGDREVFRIGQASLISTSALTIGLSHLLTKVKQEN